MKKRAAVYLGILTALALAVMATSAGAYPKYSNNRDATYCRQCHGDFRASGAYVSKVSGVAWKDPSTGASLNLHDGHRNYMLNGDCNVCHVSSSRFPVSTYSSAGGTGFPAISCTGCHDGDGLREHHVSSGADSCYDCHSPGTPPNEKSLPPYYFTPDTAHPKKPTDPCNKNGSESAVAPSLGLDNDGNLIYDAADPACAAVVVDTTPPTVTAFGIPSTSSSLTVSITTFTATDNVGVTGYMATESPSAPSAAASGWSSTAPASYTFTSAGGKTLYAWAKDAAGNVSASRSAGVVITISAPDTTPPAVTAFSVPSTSSSLTVPITTFTATDNVGITGYMVTESSSAPSASASGWSATAPASYTFTSGGSKTLYAWAKDAAGNVSAGVSLGVTITLADTTPPTVTAFSIPATSAALTVTVTSFTVTDNVAVTGYMLKETSAAPSASDAGWSATAPTSYTFSSAGGKTLYAWAKDSAGNVSASRSATVTITMSAPGNVIPPATSGLYWDDVNKNMGIGVASPAYPLSVSSDIAGSVAPGVGMVMLTGNSNKERFEIRSAGNPGGDSAPIVQGKGFGGTIAAPTATMLNHWLVALGGGGHDGTDFVIANRAMMKFIAGENWSPAAQGTFITFETTQNGTTSKTEKMRVTGDGNVGIGTTSPGQRLEINGGIKLNASDPRPACNGSSRGTFWFVNGGSGKDSVQVCATDSSGSLGWRTIY